MYSDWQKLCGNREEKADAVYARLMAELMLDGARGSVIGISTCIRLVPDARWYVEGQTVEKI